MLRTVLKVSRSVIVLDPTLKLDEVDISYRTFHVLFSGLIVKEIMRDRGWTITKSYNFLKSKFVYDEYVYSIMQRVLTKYAPPIIVNRNPGSWGSKIPLIAGTGSPRSVCVQTQIHGRLRASTTKYT